MARKNQPILVSADEEWRVEDDLRTLVNAEQIEKDPKRMAKVRALAKKRLIELAGVAAESDE